MKYLLIIILLGCTPIKKRPPHFHCTMGIQVTHEELRTFEFRAIDPEHCTQLRKAVKITGRFAAALMIEEHIRLNKKCD